MHRETAGKSVALVVLWERAAARLHARPLPFRFSCPGGGRTASFTREGVCEWAEIIPDRSPAVASPRAGDADAAHSYRHKAAVSLTLQDVERIAQLARLDLPLDQRHELLNQLNGFFRIVEQMEAVDTRGVEPLYTPLSAIQAVSLRLREDAVTEPNQREANQASAPEVQDGLFLVPRVIE
jgi:aspartyl-tRNA(Asn)/glutamyl-tRNA(Gln) amidotransferase subunit C